MLAHIGGSGSGQTLSICIVFVLWSPKSGDMCRLRPMGCKSTTTTTTCSGQTTAFVCHVYLSVLRAVVNVVASCCCVFALAVSITSLLTHILGAAGQLWETTQPSSAASIPPPPPPFFLSTLHSSFHALFIAPSLLSGGVSINIWRSRATW